MILHGTLADRAWAHYIEQVRRDPTNLYYCGRLLDHGHRLAGVEDGDALLRAAALTVFRADPFAILMTASSFSLSELGESDLAEIASGLDRVGDSADTTHFLRGKFWIDASYGKKDRQPFARRAYDHLVQVSPDGAAREPEFWPALAECCAIVDYNKFKEVLPKALASCEADWRASHLVRGLKTVIAHKDWETYLEWRPRWDELPKNSHICECYFNDIFTYDGLVALHRGNIADIPTLLKQALDVRGCPHLNSYGPDVALVEALIDRGVLLDDAEAYIDSSFKFRPDNDRLTS